MSYPPGSSVFWGRPGGVTHIWLWLGGLQRNSGVGGLGAVGWAMQGQSGGFVYDATISGVQWPPQGPRTLMSGPFSLKKQHVSSAGLSESVVQRRSHTVPVCAEVMTKPEFETYTALVQKTDTRYLSQYHGKTKIKS